MYLLCLDFDPLHSLNDSRHGGEDSVENFEALLQGLVGEHLAVVEQHVEGTEARHELRLVNFHVLDVPAPSALLQEPLLLEAPRHHLPIKDEGLGVRREGGNQPLGQTATC